MRRCEFNIGKGGSNRRIDIELLARSRSFDAICIERAFLVLVRPPSKNPHVRSAIATATSVQQPQFYRANS